MVMSGLGMNPYMLTVVYLSILQYKLVFLLPHGNLTHTFPVGVTTRIKINWLQYFSLRLL
jgi:hypothetical protein